MICRCHNNEANKETHVWIDDGQDKRGWTRVVCRFCRRFIGYRPPDNRLSGTSTRSFDTTPTQGEADE